MNKIDRSTPPDFKSVENISLIKPAHIKLANGCNIFSFNSGDQELVRIEWIFQNLRFNPAKPLLNVAVNSMLTEGTSKFSASQIADQVDFYGAFLQVDYGYDHSQAVLYTLNKHLAKTLPVMKALISDSVFPEAELVTFIRNQQQKLQVSLKKNDVLARRKFNKALYGDTSYGLGADFDDYKTLHREDMLEHFRQMYQPSNCTIVLAGKVDDDMLKLVSQSFGEEWSNYSKAADISQPELNPASEQFYFIEKPDALQSAIRMGLPIVNRLHSDFPALQVLNTVLGGYFGSRLMANIREDKGYTYGIGSGLSSLEHGGAMFIASEVGADVCRDAVTEIEKEINILKNELVPEEELSLVRNYMMGSLLGSLENVFSHADKFKNIYFQGLGYEYYDRYTEVVKNTTSEEVLQLANKYLDLNKFYKVIAGKY
jgi:zinc protease